jgi:Protein of unknown function (DUF4230)
MAMPAEPRGGRCLIALLLPALIAWTALAILVAQAVALIRGWDPGVRETPPTFSSPGPTVVQLERLHQLVSTRVHVADVLVGESRWLEGSWIIQGDALLAVDMSRAEVKDRDEKARTATIILPHPAVLSARVNHERSQQWDIKSRSWIPLVSLVLGDRTAMEKQAMLQAQQLVERAAGSDSNKTTARQGVASMLAEFYQAVGWHVSVQWK